MAYGGGLRSLLDGTGGNLSAHLRKLKDAGYIPIHQAFVDRKPHTIFAATTEEHKVFQKHVAAVQSIQKRK